MQRNILEARQISKTFHLGETKVEALDQVDLSINEGEVVAIVGKSGAGKTTLLNILGGLEIPDSGDVIVDGESLYDGINDNRRTEIRREKIGYIFQTFCLIDEIRVLENIRLPFDIQNKAYDLDYEQQLISMLQLEKKMRYYPHKLSGGERQRVAIARAIINNPKVLLLDEPLGALDLQLRRQMQHELKRLQKKLGITFIYITHDQEEAINMSDRIAVMKDGQFVQIGTPDEIYHNPKTSFAAMFVGNANIVRGTVEAIQNGVATVRIYYPDEQSGRAAEFKYTGTADVKLVESNQIQVGDAIAAAVRSENIVLGQEMGLCALVKEKSFAGGLSRLTLQLPDGKEIIASRHGMDWAAEEGQFVAIGWNPNDAIIVKDEP